MIFEAGYCGVGDIYCICPLAYSLARLLSASSFLPNISARATYLAGSWLAAASRNTSSRRYEAQAGVAPPQIQ